MRKSIALSICALAGIVAGYFVTPIVAAGIVQTKEPEIFFGSILETFRAQVLCDCNNESPAGSEKDLQGYLDTLQKARASSPNSKILAQEIGLADIRLSMTEEKLNLSSQSSEHMAQGQAEFSKLGWKDVSKSHLIHLLTELNAEYQPASKSGGEVAIATTK